MEEQPSVIGVGRDSWQDSVVDRMCVKSEDREGRTGRLNTMKKKKITESFKHGKSSKHQHNLSSSKHYTCLYLRKQP